MTADGMDVATGWLSLDIRSSTACVHNGVLSVNSSGTITVVLAECHNLVREAFRSLLQTIGGFEMIGEANGAQDVLDLISTDRPDVVLLMIDGAGERESALLHRLPDIAERTSVLVVTGDPDSALHAQAIELGAMGVLMKDQSAEILAKALRTVCAGEIWLDHVRTTGVLNRLTRRYVDEDPEVAKVESLTPRERQIVGLITEGLTNRELADKLFISEATARNHLTSILDKLDLVDRFQLTVYAFRRGLVLCPQTPAMLRVAATMTTLAYHQGESTSATVPARRRPAIRTRKTTSSARLPSA
jgi:DNA-binding NarL/FixJ family response regulator